MSDDDGFDQALFDLQVTLNSFHVSLPPPPLKPIDRFIRDYEDVCKERGITFNKKKANDQWYELQTSLKSDYKHLFEREFYTYERLKSMEAIINRNQKKLNSWNVYLEQERKRYPHLKYNEYEPLLRKQWKELTPQEQATFKDQAPKVYTTEEKIKTYEEFELLKQEYLSKSTDIPRDLEFHDKMNDVEMIIGYRKNAEGTKEYLIKWKGKSGQDATWIAKNKLRPLRTMIKYYQTTYQNPDQISYSSFSDNEDVVPLYPDPAAKADKTQSSKEKNTKKNKKIQDQEGKQNTQSEDDDRVEINPVFGLFEKQVTLNAPKTKESNKKKKITKPIKQPKENVEIPQNSIDQEADEVAQEEKQSKNKKASKQKLAPKPITKKIQKKKIETPKVLEDKKKKVQLKQVQPVKQTKAAPKVQPKPVEEIISSSDGSQSCVKQKGRRGRSKIIESSATSPSKSPSPSLEVIKPTKGTTKVTIKKGTKQEKKNIEEQKPQAKQTRNTKPKQLTPKEIVEIVKENVQKQNKKQIQEKSKQSTQTKKTVQEKEKEKKTIQVKTRRGVQQQVQPIKKAIQKRR